jgi:hypothetical protein
MEITDPLVINGGYATLGYSGDGVGNGGALTGNLALLGNYIAGSFVASGPGGTLLSEPPQTQSALLGHPHAA